MQEKSGLASKEECHSTAVAAFADTDVRVTSEGRSYLGAALGTEEYMQAFVTDKVQQWTGELERLATIARSQPHATHAAFTHGMTSKWSYLTRTMPGIDSSLAPCHLKLTDAILQQDFLYTDEIVAHQLKAKDEVHKLKREQARKASERISPSLS